MHYTTKRFWKCYDALPADIQQVADQNYELLKSNPSHPSPNIAMNIQKLTLMTISFISIVACCGSSPSLASGIDLNSKTCRVTDPTGTPLNVRLSPNGKVISKIINQTVVYPQSINYDDAGKPWILINVRQPGGDKMLGWVVREFVSCYQ